MANTEKFEVTILGTGTSAGIPVITCQCPVCTSDDPRNRRLRTSIILRNEHKDILVDCGSDFRQQALTHQINRLDAILLTHAHSDHVSGLDEIRIYNWVQKISLPIFATERTWMNVRTRFDYIFNPMQQGGGVPQVEVEEIEDVPFDVMGLRVEPLPVMHGKLPVTGFRFGDFSYITDASEVPKETINRMRGSKTLILNALRHKPHTTHMTVAQAVAVAKEVNADRTWFVHMTHDLDHEETNRDLPEGMELAYDGLTFEIEAALSESAVR